MRDFHLYFVYFSVVFSQQLQSHILENGNCRVAIFVAKISRYVNIVGTPAKAEQC